jgi:Nucleotide-diphospho-sugar transferase
VPLGRNFRWDPKAFLRMGSLKPKIVLDFFEEQRWNMVVLSDTDVVWVRDPSGVRRHRCTRVFSWTQGALRHNWFRAIDPGRQSLHACRAPWCAVYRRCL